MSRLKAAAGVVAVLSVISSCTHSTHEPGAPPAVATTVPPPAAPSPTATPPSSSPSTSSPPPAPAPLDVVPIAFAGPMGDIATVPPVPALPGPGPAAATVEVRGGWVGSFRIDGSDPRVGVSCNAQPEPRVHIAVAALNYLATTTAGTGPYGLPDGGWYLRVTRSAPFGNPAGVQVEIGAVDAAGERVDIAGFGTEKKPALAARGSADNSTIAFSFVSTAVPMNVALYEKVAGVSVTGTVVCPGPLPDLTG